MSCVNCHEPSDQTYIICAKCLHAIVMERMQMVEQLHELRKRLKEKKEAKKCCESARCAKRCLEKKNPWKTSE